MDPNESYPDRLIDEVRQRRRELFAECGHDLQKLYELIQRRQAEHPQKVFDRRKTKAPAARTS
ncbi:MAG: hypothetical protein V2A79_18790 [Planctomycetota bacterium]